MDIKQWDKKKQSVLFVYVIVFVIYNIFFWMIPFPKKVAGITVYIFSCIAMIVSYAATDRAFESEDRLVSKVYGYPVFKIGGVYALVQIVFSVFVCFFSSFISIPFWLVFILCILFLGLAVVGLIAVDTARDSIEQIQEKELQLTRTVKNFQLDVTAYIGRCRTEKEKKEMEKLAEKFRYSDPVSSPQLEPIEEEIRQEIEKLGNLFTMDEETVIQQIQLVDGLLADRNRRCKAWKQ